VTLNLLQVDHFIYDNGVIYCYAGDTLFRINSFSFYAVPEESDLEPYVEYTYRESDDGGRYCAENGEQQKRRYCDAGFICGLCDLYLHEIETSVTG
jgi:hypothetical protein